jgi:hypothetical protein
MMAVDLSASFDQFLANISLGDPQVPRMNSAQENVSAFLAQSYGMHPSAVFLQGSYANWTAIEPLPGGEYDIDLVAVCADTHADADAALSDLEARFRADGRFRARVHAKKPCVRLEYAEDDVGAFHVDVVPARSSHGPLAPLDVPRRGEGWHASAPAEYSDWCRSQGELYLRTVMMLKRWRSEQQSVRAAIKSIVLQVLIAGAMPQIGDDAERVAHTIQMLHGALGNLAEPPVVANPVLAGENLAARWTRESFDSFKRELAEAAVWVTDALAATDPIEAADIWRELFGEDFPTSTPAELGIEVGDFSHAQTPAAMGWQQAHDGRFAVQVRASAQRGRRGQNRRPYDPDGGILFAGHRLRFKAQIVAPNHVDVWWQVANTGGHARASAALRGEIFRGHDINGNALADQSENWESTAYTGSHLIRAMLVRDNRVLATSAWFRVNIYAKGRAFRL